jgi:hypothetical protein
LLVSGKWTYADAGILDRTHLRFFTWEGAQDFLREAGLQGEQVEPVLTPYHPAIDSLLKPVAEAGGNVEQARLELQVYQFVLRARRIGEPDRPFEAQPGEAVQRPASPAGTSQVDVSIIILTLNNLEQTSQCLASIHAYTPPEIYEIIVVDNGSTDNTPAFLRQYVALRPEVRVVLNKTNR